MFFEGSEKRLEIIVTANSARLRLLKRDFWVKLVACANAEILSQVSNQACDAYLLSESSLFVWDDKILILTCGNSTLVNAACYFIQALGAAHIAKLCYQRKNEYQAQLQPTTFADDITVLRQLIPGQAFWLGQLDSHHQHFFCAGQALSQVQSRFSLLMYHIRGELADFLSESGHTAQEVGQRLGLEQLLPRFQFDTHSFQPTGFSLNGISAKNYISLHITPQTHITSPAYGADNYSYVSVEMNVKLDPQMQSVMARLLALFAPSSWDLIGVNQPLNFDGIEPYRILNKGTTTAVTGDRVDFRHFHSFDVEQLVPISVN